MMDAALGAIGRTYVNCRGLEGRSEPAAVLDTEIGSGVKTEMASPPALKKSLGQHLLADRRYLSRISGAADLSPDDVWSRSVPASAS